MVAEITSGRKIFDSNFDNKLNKDACHSAKKFTTIAIIQVIEIVMNKNLNLFPKTLSFCFLVWK